ncbi:MAG: tetratricopeptide repeat protein [Ekhidna sp.]|uniref:tetratricopeptide repeat protein n=1 Tax=Ekhidna sp. TaxID=2608089 RepID=UPI0032EBA02E
MSSLTTSESKMDTGEYIQEINRLSALVDGGKYDQVVERSKELIQLFPERRGAYLIQVRVFVHQGLLVEAKNVLKEGMNHCQAPDLLLNLAIIQSRLSEFKSAYQTFKQVDLPPDQIKNPQYWFHFGRSAFEFGQVDEAIQHYKKAISLKPDHKAALNNLANILYKREERGQAEKYYLTLLKYHPKEGNAYSNLAGLYEQSGKKKKAVEFYLKAIDVSPSLSLAYYNLGQIYSSHFKDFHKALQVYEKGLKFGDSTYRSGIRLHQIIARQGIADWSEYGKDLSDLNEIIDEFLASENPVFDIVPYTLSYFKIDPLKYRRVAEKYAAKLERNTKRLYPNVKYDHSVRGGKKVKIGYLSPNLRLHPGGTLVRTLFDHHDSKKFEVHAFSLVHTDDFVNKDIRDSVDFYHDVSKMTSVEIADLINRTGVDILVALAGYNSSMKFDILAMKPAPIQMVFIGSHETTGASFVDYIFTDEYMIDDELRKAFTEKIITLPCSLLINSPFPFDDEINTSKEEHGLPIDKFVFANFNHPKKLDPETFETWMNILQKTEDSVLWLYDGGNDSFQDSLHKTAKTHNVDPQRIIIAKPLPIKQHWERFKHADLFLDNFKYNAHVTGIEALRMGVPIITLKGNNHNSRLCSSLLHYSGLRNLISSTKIDYITLSSQLAVNTADLEEIRLKLQAADNQVLFDTELQVRYLEKAYLKALIKFRKGSPPKSFNVGTALELKSFM